MKNRELLARKDSVITTCQNLKKLINLMKIRRNRTTDSNNVWIDTRPIDVIDLGTKDATTIWNAILNIFRYLSFTGGRILDHITLPTKAAYSIAGLSDRTNLAPSRRAPFLWAPLFRLWNS